MSLRERRGRRARRRPHREKRGLSVLDPYQAGMGEARGADKELGARGMPQAISQELSPASPLSGLQSNRIKASESMGPHLRLDYLQKN